MQLSHKKPSNYLWLRIFIYVLIGIIFVVAWMIFSKKAKSYLDDLNNQSHLITDEISSNFSQKIAQNDMSALDLGLLGENLAKKGFSQYAVVVLDEAIKRGSYRDLDLYAASINFNQQDYKRSLEIALRARDLDPIYPPTYDLLSKIYTSVGDNENAELCYNKYNELKEEK